MNTRMLKTLFAMVIAAAISLAGTMPASAGAVRIKLGTLAPKGSIYHRTLQEMGEAWRQAEGPGATFVIYPDGAQGGEADMVRRMRVGQLNAAAISMVGLSNVERSAAALQVMPLVYRSWHEVEHVQTALRPALEKRLYDKGFVLLLWVEAGWVRFFTTAPGAHPDDFRQRKLFVWAGDNAEVEITKALGYRPVAIETADIFPGLQTGLIDTVPMTAMWALATQVDRLAPYMVDIKWAPILGAVVVTRKVWDEMSPAGRTALRTAAQKATLELRAYQARADDEAIEVMARRGLKVQRLTPELQAAWQALAHKAYPLVRGRTVPADTFDEVNRLLAEYRRNATAP